jgi:3-oxoacyl-[acyl-carrier protein] reductase
MELENKNVLVTGGSSGIGSEIVRVLAQNGAAVGIHYHTNAQKAEAVRQTLDNSQKHLTYQADLSNTRDAHHLIAQFLQDFGHIDVLINNAGSIFGNVHFSELTPNDWNRTFALNTLAPFLLSQVAFQNMEERGGGRIINISSVSAKYGGSPYTMHYGASKAALDALTIGMSRAGAIHQILVNSIRCGFIDTEFHRTMGRTENNILKRIELIPLKRAGTPKNIADAVLFLAGSTGDFITGELLSVSGGD